MITPGQCRAARAFLKWSSRDLAERSKIGLATITRFETGKKKRTLPVVLEKLQSVFETEGVCFLENGGVVPPQDSGDEQ
jgi:transcriptional regulator with XRE-family HTH domain